MLQASAAPAIMPAFSRTAGRMASEPLDFSSGPGAPKDGAEVIPIVAPTVVAFIGRTERGPLNEPVRVKGFDEFSRIFGGPTAFSFVSLAVQHFFSHGGEAAVVVRVANRATRAMLDVPAGREILRLAGAPTRQPRAPARVRRLRPRRAHARQVQSRHPACSAGRLAARRRPGGVRRLCRWIRPTSASSSTRCRSPSSCGSSGRCRATGPPRLGPRIPASRYLI